MKPCWTPKTNFSPDCMSPRLARARQKMAAVGGLRKGTLAPSERWTGEEEAVDGWSEG